jgi:hypothetical protein
MRAVGASAAVRSAVPVVVLLIAVAPGRAIAQGPEPSGAVDLAVGLQWTGGTTIGRMDATETSPGGGRYQLFATRSTLAPATGIDGSLGVRLSRAIEVGVASSFARSSLRTQISSDVEGIPDVEVAEDVTQLTVEGAIVVRLSWRPLGRARPFVGAGAGYLRQMHEGRTLIETGSTAHVRIGLDYLLHADGRGAVKAMGLRLDARAVLRSGGVQFDDRVRVAPAVGASLFARF